MIYALGAVPIIFPPAQTPPVSGMKTYSSLDELKKFLTANSQGGSSYGCGPLDSEFFGSALPIPAPAVTSAGSLGSSNSENMFAPQVQSNGDYSTTNIQVAGVDEADTVKTGGQYIYTVSTTQNSGFYN
jgi:uncharacterized secreted protein with C-terminal beta-propeller domain